MEPNHIPCAVHKERLVLQMYLAIRDSYDLDMIIKLRVGILLLLIANMIVIYINAYKDDRIALRKNMAHSTLRCRMHRELPSGSNGYLLNLGYDGQQASAEHSLVLQQCWLGALNLTDVRIVEPFLRQTVYQGYPPHHLATDTLVFSDLHDLGHYNNVSQSRGFAQVAKWQDFMQNGPRNIVFINLGSSYSAGINYTMDCSNTSAINCCLLIPRHSGMDYLSKNGFCVVKVLDLRSSEYSLSDHHFRDILFAPWRPEEVTVVFSHWMQANSAQRLPQCFKVFRRPIMSELQVPSKQLSEESIAYREKFLGGRLKQTLSVMIRVERVIEQSVEGGHSAIARQSKASRKAYLENCFSTLTKTVNRFNSTEEPFVMTDIGKFSSNSWNRILSELNYSKTEARNVFDMTKMAVEMLVNQQFSEWENTFVNLTTKTNHCKGPAYIAALQRTIAIKSDCLLLFGGGNFQETALSAYLKHHPNRSTQCVYIVCASKSLRRNLLDILHMS